MCITVSYSLAWHCYQIVAESSDASSQTMYNILHLRLVLRFYEEHHINSIFRCVDVNLQTKHLH